MKRVTSFLLAFLFLCELPLWAGLGGHKALYVGGTVVGLKEKTEGSVSITEGNAFVFGYKGGKTSIPYDRVTSLEYGQKAGRRLGLGIAVSPLFLFSKKRRHYLTIGYVDENNKQQGAVFELGKDIIHSTLTALESKTGKKIEYEDEEAKKSASKEGK